jgi:hypothetical protein
VIPKFSISSLIRFSLAASVQQLPTKWLPCCLILMFLSPAIQAVPVDDLYTAEVLVSSQDATQLKRGAQAGLLQVLIRISGSQQIESNPLVVDSLKNPAAYYYQYSYESTARSFQIGDELIAAHILQLKFEPSSIAQLVRQAGYPVWGSNRPSVLLWVAQSDGVERSMLAGQNESDVTVALNTQARERGLPLLYPLFDLEDSSMLSTAEVWGAFTGRIEAASKRYSPDAVITGRIQKDQEKWSGSWAWNIDGKWVSFSNVAYNANDLVADVIDNLADALAARYAIDSSRGSLMVRVEDLDSLGSYAQVTRYLESLAPVLASSVVEIIGSEILFQLSTEGRSEQLIEIIQLDEKMVMINQGRDQRGRELLHYKWLKRN